ncbi:hypothetical protein SAMN05428989_1956 [Pseudoxanthomonas sp. GM95]|uniref:hypothetical protein n=1 Tax=Pseudoxanthomonas sp. GM95 TaxID=1881043 RepID=UPI0008C20C9E|nr:hypothetical protein [Pseudoxanthomonas sp. GM95]SEL57223.1 hypothetical protein SAMN05428989_1956 [Pseudoxanthomonas sp. GM95]
MAAHKGEQRLEELGHSAPCAGTFGSLKGHAQELAAFHGDASRAVARIRSLTVHGVNGIYKGAISPPSSSYHLELVADEMELRAQLIDAEKDARRLADHSNRLFDENQRDPLAGESQSLPQPV